MVFHNCKNKIILEKFLECRKEKYKYKCREKHWIISFIVSSIACKVSLLYSEVKVNGETRKSSKRLPYYPTAFLNFFQLFLHKFHIFIKDRFGFTDFNNFAVVHPHYGIAEAFQSGNTMGYDDNGTVFI